MEKRRFYLFVFSGENVIYDFLKLNNNVFFICSGTACLELNSGEIKKSRKED